MIQPDEIQQKAGRLYPKAVAALLRGEDSFFPHRLPCDLKPPKDQSELIASVERLRQASKEVLGWGFSIAYESRRSQQHGQNNFPIAIYLESMDDLLRLVRKSTEYRSLITAVQQIRDALPELESWLHEHWLKIPAAAADVPDLIRVTLWLKDNPRPGCFPREIPLPVSSKLVENNRSILAAWWDRLLPHGSIDYGCDSKYFSQRYGFLSAQTHLLLRVLDDDWRQSTGFPFVEFSLPPSELNRWLEREDGLRRVVIVENKINLLTFPKLPHSIALGGLGFGVSMLSQVPRLRELELIYWGDLDVEGFQILSQLRTQLPHSRSWLMDLDTLGEFRSLAGSGNGSVMDPPMHLTADEKEAFLECRDRNLRLEQERIPQPFVLSQATLRF